MRPRGCWPRPTLLFERHERRRTEWCVEPVRVAEADVERRAAPIEVSWGGSWWKAEVLERRTPLYERLAHYRVDTDSRTVAEVVAEIERLLSDGRSINATAMVARRVSATISVDNAASEITNCCNTFTRELAVIVTR